MLLLYFKTDKASFREQWFFLEVISVKFMDLSKAKIFNISAERPKMKTMSVLYFRKLLKFHKIKWSYFLHFRDIENLWFWPVDLNPRLVLFCILFRMCVYMWIYVLHVRILGQVCVLFGDYCLYVLALVAIIGQYIVPDRA